MTNTRAWHGGNSLALAMLIVAGLTGCAGGCPLPSSPVPAQQEWERDLEHKRVLALDPHSPIAIKRDVHNLVVAADARALAEAFHQVMTDPTRRFGLITVNRVSGRAGQPFVLGERFQGRYSIEGSVRQQLEGKWERAFGKAAGHEAVRQFFCRVENETTSDYGVIDLLQLDPPAGRPFMLRYRYLEGTPIAGSSTFIITQLGPGQSQLTQIFEYQELEAAFTAFFSAGGLQLHNQVVYSQTEQAAALIGTHVVSSDIPVAYAHL